MREVLQEARQFCDVHFLSGVRPVAARLAGVGGLKIADAGKPGCYERVGVWGFGVASVP